MKRWFALFLICCLFPSLFGCERRIQNAPAEASPPAEETASPVIPLPEKPNTAKELTLDESCDAEGFLAVLPQMPALTSVRWSPCPLSPEERKELRERCPDIRFDWELELGNSRFSSLDEAVDLSGEKKDVPALLTLLPLMEAKTVDLSGWDVTPKDAAALRAVRDDIDYLYPVELYGMTFSSDDREIDFGDLVIMDTEELEDALVLFNHPEKVLMLKTTLDNDSMDALNARHEGTQFVWLVQVMTLAIRSDRTYFTIYNADELRYTREPVTNLRYCHDLIAVDLGHCGIGQDDLEFVRGCPHLQFLIVAECYIKNLEPLRACPELRYLEAFKSYLTDVSALADCPKLTDLNLCYIPSLGPECVDTLKEMKQLEHLWFCDANFAASKIIELRDALPDTEFLYFKGPESTGAGWRYHDIYYEMRDALHMHYMN